MLDKLHQVMSSVIMVCGHRGCGRHGHCLWPSWFVAVIVEPHFYMHSYIFADDMDINLKCHC